MPRRLGQPQQAAVQQVLRRALPAAGRAVACAAARENIPPPGETQGREGRVVSTLLAGTAQPGQI